MAEVHLDKHQKHLFLYGGLAVGAVVIFFVAESSHQQPGQKGPLSKSITANPQQASLDQSIIAARSQALQAYDTSVLGRQQTVSNQNIAVNTNRTQQLIAYNTNAAQTAQDRIAAATAQAIANTQANAQIAGYNAALQAQQGQQSTSLWQSIIGGITSFLPFLGL